MTLKGDLKINDGTNDKFVVSASSGNTEVSGTLNAGATTLTSTLDVTGNTEMTGTLSVGGTHADTNKELYVNGDIEATATLEVGTTLSSLDVTGTPR